LQKGSAVAYKNIFGNLIVETHADPRDLQDEHGVEFEDALQASLLVFGSDPFLASTDRESLYTQIRNRDINY